MATQRPRFLIAFASLASLLVCAPTSQAASIYALTVNNHLLNFDSAAPGATTDLPITGLVVADDLIGIDFRPANGLLYGLSNSRLYTINTTTGAATLASILAVSIPTANGYGMDFNPVVDRLRIVTSSQLNLRVNVDTGAVTVDPLLAYAAADPHAAVPPSISAAGYTNNTAGALTTTLYDIDIELNNLAIQNPPNNGTLNSVGGLGIISNSIERAGLDIATDAGGVNTAFANLSTQNSPNGFYSVNLGTGAVGFIGDIGVNRFTGDVEDIAIAPGAVPPPGGGGNAPLPPALLLAIPGAALAAYKARRHRA